ncbi:peptide deformylase 1A, chloroplastic isoform X2 [Coffea arabica]|uniref:Peptide deformylase n=1 Tax=Coffea arabica TaxID=13443 RepID=A0ABM4U7K2_COFAR
MEGVQRFTHRLFPVPIVAQKCLQKTFTKTPLTTTHLALTFRKPIFTNRSIHQEPALCSNLITSASIKTYSRSSSSTSARAGWFLGLTEKKQVLPEIVKAGDPVLHELAQEVRPDEIGSERIQKIIEDMVKVMRKAPGVGLAAPQIGIPLKVIINPKLKKKGKKAALFFEGCLSVDGFRAVVERCLEVEVTGLNQGGQPIKIDASGWQARILQHECDHLDGTLYVDKMVPRTFRTVENLDLPLAHGCPKLGVRLLS